MRRQQVSPRRSSAPQVDTLWALSSPTEWICGGYSPNVTRYDKPERRFDDELLESTLEIDVTTSSALSEMSNTPAHEAQMQPKASTSHSRHTILSTRQTEGCSRLISVDVPSAMPSVESIIAPNVNKLPPCALVEVRLQSSSDVVKLLCSSDVLKMKSPFFQALLAEQDSMKPVGTGREDPAIMWRNPIIISESSPYEAAALLENLHENYLRTALTWNSTFCRLSVTWALEEFVIIFAELIDIHIHKMISFVKVYNWRTNSALLAGMDVVVFMSDLGDQPVLLTGKIVTPDTRIGYSHVRCALDMTNYSEKHGDVTSPVYTDTELRTSADGNRDDRHGIVSAQEIAQHSYFEETLLVNITEPFWIRPEGCGKWLTPDEYCTSNHNFELSQAEKRKFWEMLRLLHELSTLNQKCRNRMKTAEQIAALFKRKEFAHLWSSEGPDCLTTDALMLLVASQFE